jgi:tRNA(Ile)-lysidine synthase
MIEDLQPGTYIVAVSGGVDSMALLDMLVYLNEEWRMKNKASKKTPFTIHHSPFKFIVAHLDHGIRKDSHLDRKLVQERAKAYGLPFVYHHAKLGQNASEAVARRARYDFLQKVREASGAKAIITAHHQDDMLETAAHNLLRGTGRRGLSSIRSTDTVIRPLLHVTKAELQLYAQLQKLDWREDSTNQDVKYRRNHIRHNILPRLNTEQRERLHAIIKRMHQLNDEIEAHLVNHLHVRLDRDQLDRKWFIQLPHTVAKEVMHAWLRRHSIKNIDKKSLERLVVAAKTFPYGARTDVDGRHVLWMQKDVLLLKHSK